MAVLWPTVKATLVTVIPTIGAFASSTVYDGPTPSGDALPSWVSVGWQPSTPEDPSAGSFAQAPGPPGFAAQEDGSIFLEFGATTGDPEVPDVFALVEAFSAWVQQNQTLGVLSANATASTEAQVLEAQSTAGATQRVLVTLSYTSLVS